jgi:cytochrome c biogenesis protein CcmG/thiol:disulfide interchange protein DsbE
MADSKEKKKTSIPRALAYLITLAAAVFVFLSFKDAVKEGLAWKESSDWATIAPDFEALDPNTAKKIPDFSLKDRFGNEIRLSQFASADLLLVNLWSSTCPPCAREIPSLAEMDRRLPVLGKAVLVTITVDEKWEDVASFFPQGTDLRVLFDPEKKVVEGIFGTTKFPETFILDKERRIRARFDGIRNWHLEEMLDYIASFK